MRAVQIVFSPTGGTQKVMDILTEGWEMDMERIDLSDPQMDGDGWKGAAFQKEDVALIAVPSYGGRVPTLAARRLAKVRGGKARCVLVCVYGNRAYEDTLVELEDIAVQCGFRVTAAVAAIAEHSIMHQYATGRPDAADAGCLRDFGAKILEKLERAEGDLAIQDLPEKLADQDAPGSAEAADHTEPAVSLPIPGNRPYKKLGVAKLVPKTGRQCEQCGLCAKVCPAQAIDPADVKKTDQEKCISCMRCVARCPKGARKVNEALVAGVAMAIKKACSVRKENALYL